MRERQIEQYFKARAKEIQRLLKDRSPWGFVCAAAFLDCLSKLVAGKDDKRNGYKTFVKNYLARVNPIYLSFRYKSGAKDLPDQLYHVLRCGIVHQFSLVPDEQSLKNGGRLRSIVLCHRKESKRRNLPHLSSYSSGKSPDAAVFVAEDFAKDLMDTVRFIFSSQAKTVNPEIVKNIEEWVEKYPPIMGGF